MALMPDVQPPPSIYAETKSSQVSSGRKPLQQRTNSETNWNTVAAVRLVPKTPPRLLGKDNSDDSYCYSRSPLPTQSSHVLSPRSDITRSTLSATEKFQTTPNVQSPNYTTIRQPLLKPSVKKRQLHIHHDNKTFSLKFPEKNEEESRPETTRERDSRTTSPTRITSSPLKPCSKYLSYASSSVLNKAKSLQTQCSTGPKIPGPSCISSSEFPKGYSSSSASNKSKELTYAKSINSSPCNYEFVGGLRKVAKTPEHKNQEFTSPQGLFSHIQLPDIDQSLYVTKDLSSKPSFSSTESTCSETTNYKIYSGIGSSISPRSLHLIPSPSNSTRSPSRKSSPGSLPTILQRTIQEPNQRNNELRSTPASPSSEDSSSSQLSLVVSPLAGKSRKSRDKFGFHHSASRESLRTASSLTSLSSIFIHSESLRGIISTSSIVQIPFHSFQHKNGRSRSSSWVESLTLYPPRSHMNEHPHQWSSQLSTVLSVSENGSDHSSLYSEASRNSLTSRRRVMSIESGYMSPDPVTPISRSMSWSESTIDQPPIAFSHRPRNNSTSSIRMVGEQDEYGDGITDLQIMRSRPLKRRASAYYSSTSSENGRTNTMKSSISTKSNSLNLSLLPTWAKIYYGNGERYLRCGSTMSGYDSRTNSFRNDSTGVGSTLNIYSPRGRPRESDQPNGSFLNSNPNPLPLQSGSDSARASPKTLNSWSMASVWSPHLRHNSRIKRPCIWGPPSADFPSGGGMLEKRNLQVIMFILGFLFPLSWMIAAVLPLKPLSERELHGSNLSSPSLSSPSLNLHPNEMKYNAAAEARHESAVWWRKLNRWMSIVGLLIIGLIVALIFIGIRQGWG